MKVRRASRSTGMTFGSVAVDSRFTSPNNTNKPRPAARKWARGSLRNLLIESYGVYQMGDE
jgi:hypothetical protein